MGRVPSILSRIDCYLYLSLLRAMTEKQQYIYSIIDAWWRKRGFAPSIQDIMDITGDKSKGNIHRIIKKLVELGHCKKLPYSARSVRPSYIRVRSLLEDR